MASLWRHRDFLRLWAGQTVSQIGSRITREGIPMTAAVALAASPLQMGILSASTAVAVLLFGLFAGAWVDRLRRRPLMIAADVARGAVLAMVPLAAFRHVLSMKLLYVVAGISGILTVLFDSAYQAYVPSLVERDDLVSANSKLALTESIAEVSGPGTTGILVQILTAPIAIAFDAASFLISAFSLLLIRKREPRPEPSAHPDMLREIADGLRFAWGHPLLRPIILRTATGAFSIGGMASLYVYYAVRILHLSPAALGFVIAIGGGTSLLGALAAPRIVARIGLGRSMIASGIFVGSCALLIPLARGSALSAAMFLGAAQLGDFAWPLTNISEITLRQGVSPPHLLGRVNSAMSLLMRGVLPAGAFAGAVAAEWVGVRTALLASAGGFLASTLFLIFSPVLRCRHLTEKSAAQIV